MKKVKLTESKLKSIIKNVISETISKKKGKRLNESYSASLKVTDEITSLDEFEFWGPAKGNIQELTSDERDSLLFVLSDCYPEGITSVQLNDIVAYDFDWVCEAVGHNEEEEEETEDYEDEEEEIDNI